ncbi:hypothetical protein ANN_04021 [Periplaneta americana]|uniref:PDZ domain-containing protein n=1 Tax=Periplaneta americana TaxID=6978 RepID=A0ABQ8T7F0_PERAM|nr:hypothetical protein ANN_04021 [Periplaneta americana]
MLPDLQQPNHQTFSAMYHRVAETGSILHQMANEGRPSVGCTLGRKSVFESMLLKIQEPQVNVVALRSHDFTGLGFNICGNMRDGIFVKDVLHRGPASESGRIAPGDRIDSIRISFRHMVFEDALTILSYASPYDVQLEVENASNSRPNTLIRTKRTSGSSIAPADRICHPFYRSQSIADLAQIGKASLKRMQQMGGITKAHWTESQTDDSGDYPTLKLSSTPTGNEVKKDNTKLEKTAPPSNVTIVKPERAKKLPTKSNTPPPYGHENRESSTQDEGLGKETVSRFQKFGVRVLPDTTSSHRDSQPVLDENAKAKQATNRDVPNDQGARQPGVEAEHKQNEHNSIIEKVGEGSTSVAPCSNYPSTSHRGLDVDGTGGKPKPNTFCYDERGIDVGPMEPQRSQQKHSSSTHQCEENRQGGETHGESNVKNLLSKGLQNLKEKLHPHDKKRNGTQNSDSTDNNDQEMQDATGHADPQVVDSDISKKNGKPKDENSQQIESKEDKSTDHKSLNPQEGEIPTEIPEEVRRAAMAARSNRKSLGNVAVEAQAQEGKRAVLQDGPSGGSSSESEEASPGSMDSDSLGRTPKRPNKRKAPPPPEESEEKISAGRKAYVEPDIDSKVGTLNSDKQRLKDTVQHNVKRHSAPTIDVENIQNAEEVAGPTVGKHITSFADLARHRNNTENVQKEITNITIESNNIKPLTSGTSILESQKIEGSSGKDEPQNTKSQQPHLDYDIGVNVSSINSDSDSDLERLEGDDDSYDGIVKNRKTKKGGTTIELNSSHITIHHSPSSDTVQLESESTRKAASLGDLSRLDSEQPMSILERAVSLDLADGGGTPHGSKKRKAPLPPPGEDYLGGMPDGEDGVAHRKEPRLDSAMDTFQRRRLKKSSDWGTLEEALMQTDSKSLDLQSVKGSDPVSEDVHLQSSVTVLKSNSIDNLPKSDGRNDPDTLAYPNSLPGISRTDILNVDEVNYSTLLGYGNSGPESIEQMEGDAAQHQQKTVLRITPEPAAEPGFTSSSQVTIASSAFNTSPTHQGEVTNLPRYVTDQAQAYNTKVASAYNLTQSSVSSPSSPQHSTINPVLGMFSSTPISHSGEAYNKAQTHNSSDSLQSPIVTSSHTGISSVHVVSSTTHDITDADSNITDPFITAVDSTTNTLAGDMSKVDGADADEEDVTWGQDLQPPELPTSPVPVLSQLSSFKPSPSMTYITEIQVVTTADSSSNPTAESTTEEQHSTPMDVTSSTVMQRVLKYKSDSSLSSDSIGSEGDDKEADTPRDVTTSSGVPQKSNVTVTAIRNTVSRIPMRITTDRTQSAVPSVHIASNSVNHITNTEERRTKPARPPVPPRKTDSSTLSTVTMDGSSSGGSGRIQPMSTESIHIGPPPSASSSGKFISFSSLTPQVTTSTENGAGRNSTSFEQWVFLDEGGTHNGLEGSNNTEDSTATPHAMVVSLPSRTQSITHIVLDTKQSNGNHGKP